MYPRLPLLLGALALILFGAALAVASPFGSSHAPRADDATVRLTRVDVVVDGGFAPIHREAHITDTVRLRQLAKALPVPLPASRRMLTYCNDCRETSVTVRAAGGVVRRYGWAERPPPSLQPFATALSRLI
jgi:hypothetical protein